MNIVGNTPIVEYDNLYFKLEYKNPTGSIKDRAAYNILTNYLKQNIINKGDTVVISTSGNIGISIAYFGKILGLNVIVTMPSNMSKERIELMEKYDAKVILTEGLYVLNEEVRDIMDVKVYVFTPLDVIKERWYKRAVSRGKTGEAADLQFKNVNETVYVVNGCNVRSSCSTETNSNKIGGLVKGQAVKGIEGAYAKETEFKNICN